MNYQKIIVSLIIVCAALGGIMIGFLGSLPQSVAAQEGYQTTTTITVDPGFGQDDLPLTTTDEGWEALTSARILAALGSTTTTATPWPCSDLEKELERERAKVNKTTDALQKTRDELHDLQFDVARRETKEILLAGSWAMFQFYGQQPDEVLVDGKIAKKGTYGNTYVVNGSDAIFKYFDAGVEVLVEDVFPGEALTVASHDSYRITRYGQFTEMKDEDYAGLIHRQRPQIQPTYQVFSGGIYTRDDQSIEAMLARTGFIQVSSNHIIDRLAYVYEGNLDGRELSEIFSDSWASTDNILYTRPARIGEGTEFSDLTMIYDHGPMLHVRCPEGCESRIPVKNWAPVILLPKYELVYGTVEAEGATLLQAVPFGYQKPMMRWKHIEGWQLYRILQEVEQATFAE